MSSGASYQARVGAYIIASGLCEVDSEIARFGTIDRVSFETTEDVDDINVILKDNSTIYIQAKSKISYSTSAESDFHSVLRQFSAQEIKDLDRLVLATSSRSSKKVIFDLRTALEAFNSSPEKEFFVISQKR